MYNNNKHALWRRCTFSMVAVMLYTSVFSINSNYQFINNKTQTSFRFQLINNLIVIPVKVNEMELNLILDTGIRSIVLFGKRFERKLDMLEGKTVKLSGYGKKKNRPGKFSLNNDIAIQDIRGSRVGIVVMPNPDLFRYVGMYEVDGIIGYEIFSRFIVKIDYPNRHITLFEPFNGPDLYEFETIPLTVKDTKPYIKARLHLNDGQSLMGYYHVDTGSAQDLLLFMNEKWEAAAKSADPTHVGMGIGGRISGHRLNKLKLQLAQGVERNLEPKLIKRGFSNRELGKAEGSIGSGLLKSMVIVFDYIHMTFHVQREKQQELYFNYPRLMYTDI